VQAEEFMQARARQPKPMLKSLFWKGRFGSEFIEAARGELPFLWGRLNLLEEFYDLNAPGFSERSRRLHDQLGSPKAHHPGWARRLLGMVAG
jgi:hypothetical protein